MDAIWPDVEVVKKFTTTGGTMGVTKLHDHFFVCYKSSVAPVFGWTVHCGPYSSAEHAREWIHGIRESGEPRPPNSGSRQ